MRTTMVEKFNDAVKTCGSAYHKERDTALLFCKIADIFDEFTDDAERRLGPYEGEIESNKFFEVLYPALEFLQDRCSFHIVQLAESL